ncbi:hypothetical protein TNCV_969691 [Trichonephila clavipes]|nr:hypothetical protein TNCV_969691 [Trichonephila clavipes]
MGELENTLLFTPKVPSRKRVPKIDLHFDPILPGRRVNGYKADSSRHIAGIFRPCKRDLRESASIPSIFHASLSPSRQPFWRIYRLKRLVVWVHLHLGHGLKASLKPFFKHFKKRLFPFNIAAK